MHLTIVAYGTWGDVRPGIALGLALKKAGYVVRLIVTEDFARWVKDIGLDIHMLPVNKFEVMKRVSSRTNPLQVMAAIRKEIGPALFRAGRDLVTMAADTDGFLVNEWLLGLVSGITESRRLKLVQISMQPEIRTGEMAIPTMPALPDWLPFRGVYNLLSYDFAHNLRWYSYVHTINSLRKTLMDLPPLSSRGYLDLLDQTPSITLLSQHVIPRPKDWHVRHHLTGFLFYDDVCWRPPTDLVKFIQDGEAPVYIGFGSMHDRDPERTTKMILEAVKSTQSRAVLYKGWANLGRSKLPKTICPLDYAPHNWLFPQMAAVVHHAGSGTSAAALRAGVPSVPVPHSGDQPFWARRLYQLGAGTRPLPRSRLSADALASRITQAVHEPEIRKRAAELSARISGEDGATRTVAVINEILNNSD